MTHTYHGRITCSSSSGSVLHYLLNRVDSSQLVSKFTRALRVDANVFPVSPQSRL